MAGLGTLLRSLARDNGVELDDDELAKLGLDEDGDPQTSEPSDVLSIPLPGRAAGEVEIFLSEELSTSAAAKQPLEVEGDKLMWYPIIRSGQWAVRPGTQGRKRKVPLKVVSGHSKNQRKEIGLQDLKDSFDDEAIQHVTVPTSHANTTIENTGFIKGMKIVKGEYKDKKTKQKMPCDVLMGGYDIKLPEIKRRMTLGAIANRSAGILYDYVNTETGKTYPAVIEHVALTNKPWITGMVSFGRPLSEGGIETVGLSLSDEAPFSEDEYAEVLQLGITDEDRDFLAVSGVAWDHETSPSWLRTQVDQILSEARSKKLRAKRNNNGTSLVYDDYPPNYRCVEAKPGSALIRDGWGDDANAWIAGISVKDGAVALDDFSEWTAVAKVYMPDDRSKPPKDKEPLAEQPLPVIEREPLSRLELAQLDRRRRARDEEPGLEQNNNTPRGGGNMAGETGAVLSDLPPEAQRVIQEAERRAREAEERATKLDERVQRLTGTVNSGEVTTYINWLKSDEGLGLTEERGFGGALAELSALMLADDGEPAVQSDHFAADGNTTGELTLSESFKRVFAAIHKATEGKKRLGELLSQPADPEGEEFEVDEHGKPKLDAEGKPIPKVKAPEGGTNAGDETSGKPPAAGGEGEQLSTEQRVEKIVELSPEVARVLGRRPTPAGAGGASTQGGDR
jgi:hypothetical protein